MVKSHNLENMNLAHNKKFEQLCKEILDNIDKIKDYKNLDSLKQKIVREKYKGLKIPNNIELFLYATKKQQALLNKITPIKPIRELSGVNVIAIMTKPFRCPHGKCAMCPGGINSYFGNTPQSYTGKEPATMRAIRNKYDPYLQVMNRLEQYIVIGKIPQKIELIIMGGTFPSFRCKYQQQFILYALKAMNDFSSLFFRKEEFLIKKFKKFFLLPGKVDDPKRVKLIHQKLLNLKAKLNKLDYSILKKILKKNETSNIRCIGITVETRPDQASFKQLNFLLNLGVTRLEIGLQSTYDSALKTLNRGHTVQDSINAIRRAKDLGFKINLHFMLNIPGLTPKQELESLKKLFEDESFKPDMLKIYPLYIIKGTKLYHLYKNKKYQPYNYETLRDILVKFKTSIIPPYTRIMRIQRDIPTTVVEAGVKISNLRQMIENYMNTKGLKCKCIRCREIGRTKKITNSEKIKIYHYKASKGEEFFISCEDIKNNYLIGFIRMRYPSQSLRREITNKTALIRELHIYGNVALIGTKIKDKEKIKKRSVQHQGIGKLLLKKAEQIARGDGKDKMVIISGIGVRQYYRKLGYRKQGPYVIKKL